MAQYTVLSEALSRVKERSGATAADDAYLTELLVMSAGIDPNSVTHYRVFYCAAKWLEQSLGSQALTEADGVKFTGLAKPIASFLNMQAAYDTANQLTVPAGFEATSTAAVTARSQRFGTRSNTPQVQP